MIDDVTLYDGASAGPQHVTIAVRDGRFVSLAPPGETTFAATRRIDGRGRYVTPGLWDMHVHLRSSDEGGLDAAAFLHHGVTTVRDLGSLRPRLQAVLAALDAEPGGGPHVLPGFEMLNGQSFGPFQRAVTDAEALRAAVDDLAAAGAAHVKTHNALPPALLPVLVERADRHGLPVIAHGPRGMHPLAVCRAGARSLEHVGALVEGIFTADAEGAGAPAAIAELLSDASEPLMVCLRERGVFVTPTLGIYPNIARRRAGDGPMPEAYTRFIDDMQRIVRRLHESGVALLAGSDISDLPESVVVEPGLSLHAELRMLEDAGIAPLDVLRIATIHGARVSGTARDRGSVEAGKIADFLILSADPAATVDNLTAIVAVFKAGEQVAGATSPRSQVKE